MHPEKPQIQGLKGQYCPACVQSLTGFGLARFSILPMCVYDLQQLLANGDMQRIQKMIDEKENQKSVIPQTLANS